MVGYSDRYDLARAFCKHLKGRRVDYWVLSGLTGLRENVSRDLDLLVEKSLSVADISQFSREVSKELGWEYIGLNNRFYGHLRLFFINPSTADSFEIDLMPDFMFGPVNVCEGSRKMVIVDDFQVCENATFSKAILVKLLSGNFISIKNRDYKWAEEYLRSEDGVSYLEKLVGKKVTGFIKASMMNRQAITAKEKKSILKTLVAKEFRKSGLRFLRRTLRWVVFEIRRKGGLGTVAPIIQIANCTAAEAEVLTMGMEVEFKAIVPFSKIELVELVGKNLFETINLFSDSRRISTNLELPVELTGNRKSPAHMVGRGARVFLDAKQVRLPEDLEALRELVKHAFLESLDQG